MSGQRKSGWLDRRMMTGGLLLGVPAFGVVGYAAQTGRIDLLTPILPDDGDIPAVPGVSFDGKPVPGLARAAFRKA